MCKKQGFKRWMRCGDKIFRKKNAKLFLKKINITLSLLSPYLPLLTHLYEYKSYINEKNFGRYK